MSDQNNKSWKIESRETSPQAKEVSGSIKEESSPEMSVEK